MSQTIIFIDIDTVDVHVSFGIVFVFDITVSMIHLIISGHIEEVLYAIKSSNIQCHFASQYDFIPFSSKCLSKPKSACKVYNTEK